MDRDQVTSSDQWAMSRSDKSLLSWRSYKSITLISLLCFSSDHGDWVLKWGVRTIEAAQAAKSLHWKQLPWRVAWPTADLAWVGNKLLCAELLWFGVVYYHSIVYSILISLKANFCQQSEFYGTTLVLEWWFINLSTVITQLMQKHWLSIEQPSLPFPLPPFSLTAKLQYKGWQWELVVSWSCFRRAALHAGWCNIVTLKLAMKGVFTPKKLAKWYTLAPFPSSSCRELVVEHLNSTSLTIFFSRFFYK